MSVCDIGPYQGLSSPAVRDDDETRPRESVLVARLSSGQRGSRDPVVFANRRELIFFLCSVRPEETLPGGTPCQVWGSRPMGLWAPDGAPKASRVLLGGDGRVRAETCSFRTRSSAWRAGGRGVPFWAMRRRCTEDHGKTGVLILTCRPVILFLCTVPPPPPPLPRYTYMLPARVWHACGVRDGTSQVIASRHIGGAGGDGQRGYPQTTEM